MCRDFGCRLCAVCIIYKRGGEKKERKDRAAAAHGICFRKRSTVVLWVKLGGGGGGPLVRLRTYEEHCVMTFEDVKKKGRKKCCVGGCINLKHLFLHLFFFFLERRPIFCTCVLVRMYSEKKS